MKIKTFTLFQTNSKLFKAFFSVLSVLLLMTLSSNSVNAQVLTDFPCYTVSEDQIPPNYLFVFDPATGLWTNVNPSGIGTTFIEAIATDPINGIIYATDLGILGTLDPATAAFTPINAANNTGNGDFGLVDFDDLDGLTYDPVRMVLWATERITAAEGYPADNDLITMLDPATGLIIPGQFVDSAGNPADYAVVQEVVDGTFGGPVFDVDDIALNPCTGEIFVIQNQGGTSGVISLIDPVNGQTQPIYDSPTDDIEGLGFTYYCQMYATSGDNGPTQLDSNNFIFIDYATGSTTVLNQIDPNGVIVDFESFDCFTAYNDLALDKVIDPAQPTPIYEGDVVTFLVTVYNQGTMENENILLTDYIPTGLTLADPNWTQAGATATTTIPGPLAPGAQTTVPIMFTVDAGFSGQITNFAEITESFYPGAIDPITGQPAPLGDIDSTPDGLNNETGVVDNEINESGPILGEDEDDHDPETITIEVFDLALIKEVSPAQTTPILPGDDVTFTLTVENQGNVSAQNINLVDYIPTGFTLSPNDANGWVAAGATATNTIAGPLAAGANTTVDIVLQVDPTFAGGQIINVAEIAAAEDTAGNTPTDVDSTPDTTAGNDPGGAVNTASDDVLTGDGTGAPGDAVAATDEDDQDPEDIIVEIFDLALTKVVSAPAAGTPVYPGDDVTFTITVFNQGTIDAQNVDVIDYIPAGFVLSPNDANGWVAAGANATNTIAGPIAPAGSTTIDIVLQVDPTLTAGTDLVNVAEITEAENLAGTVLPDNDSTPDATPGNDAGGNPETPSDDVTGGDGSGAPGDTDPATDEDDSDPALVPIEIFDLALIMM